MDWLAGQRLHPDAFLTFLADIEAGRLEIVDVQAQDYRRVSELLDRYRDLPLGFVDAAVLAVVERLKETMLATLDRRHFSMVRPPAPASDSTDSMTENDCVTSNRLLLTSYPW